MKRFIVCGGRNYKNVAAIEHALTVLHQRIGIACIIHGGASGADDIAAGWALSNGIQVYEFEAKWNSQGRRAGPIRNALMLEEGKPDGVVAFPGGSGTKDMVKQARAAGVTVWKPIKWSEDDEKEAE